MIAFCKKKDTYRNILENNALMSGLLLVSESFTSEHNIDTKKTTIYATTSFKRKKRDALKI